MRNKFIVLIYYKGPSVSFYPTDCDLHKQYGNQQSHSSPLFLLNRYQESNEGREGQQAGGDEDVQEERDGASCQLDIETAMGIWILSPPQSSNVLKRQVKFFCVIDTVLCDDCR